MRVIFCLALLLPLILPASEDDWFKPLGAPPRAAPKRISGGESFPPLPLPATPLRRSERKRQPSPPPLIGKVVWGEAASFQEDGGATVTIADWNLVPADLQALMDKAKRTLGVPYGHEETSLATFHWDPVRLPVLFVSGVRTVTFGEEQLARLRDYVLRGGMVVFDSVAGSPYFTAAARAAAARAFPDRPLRVLPADHPLHHMVADVEKAGFPRNAPGDTPRLEAVHVGSRCGILVSPYGLGTGWDDHGVERVEQAVFYDVDTATRIGVNLVAYAIGYANVGREEAKPELFGALDERRPANEFVFAQIRHDGHWDVHPGAAAALLARLATDSALAVNRRRVAVLPGSDDLAPYQVLYLTGADDFALSGAAQEALRAFLRRHGTLIIDNGLGLAGFDAAVRRELAALLPGARLEPLPPDHPLFTAAVPVGAAQYTPAVLRERPDLTAPLIEGIAIDGDLRVLYSPYALGAGWDGVERPMVKGFQPPTALALGVNLVVHAVTH